MVRLPLLPFERDASLLPPPSLTLTPDALLLPLLPLTPDGGGPGRSGRSVCLGRVGSVRAVGSVGLGGVGQVGRDVFQYLSNHGMLGIPHRCMRDATTLVEEKMRMAGHCWLAFV